MTAFYPCTPNRRDLDTPPVNASMRVEGFPPSWSEGGAHTKRKRCPEGRTRPGLGPSGCKEGLIETPEKWRDRRRLRYGYLTLRHMLKREGLVATRKRKAAPARGLACKSAPSGAGGCGGLGFRWPRRPGRTSAGRSTSCPTSWPAAAASASSTSSMTSPGRASASWRPTRSPESGWRPSRADWAKGKTVPKVVALGSAPEPASKAMRFWSERSGAALNFIQPGKPTQNAFVESFNGKFRGSCLKAIVQGPRRRQARRERLASPLQPVPTSDRIGRWAKRHRSSGRNGPPDMAFPYSLQIEQIGKGHFS